MVFVSISLPSIVIIPSEIADLVVELALPLEPTPKFGTRPILLYSLLYLLPSDSFNALSFCLLP